MTSYMLLLLPILRLLFIMTKTTLDYYFMLLIAIGTLLLGLLPQAVLSIGILITLVVAYRQHRPIK